MARAPILVVEDDAKVAATIRLYLEHGGYAVETVADGAAALARATAEPAPALILLDVMLPGVDGLEVCRRLRARSDVPIILVTARAGEEDKLEGLDLGADDYVAKPFSPRELVARVRAVLRRSGENESAPPIERAGVRLDPARHEVRVEGRVVALTPREFVLLYALMRAAGRAFTRDELVERVMGSEFAGLDRTIDVHVRNLRRKIETDPANPRRIETVGGVGYRFTEHA